MNSTELIKSCKKRFEELHEERENFEDELLSWLDFHRMYNIGIEKKELEYFLSSCKSFHWRSFYNGFLEGSIEHLKDANT